MMETLRLQELQLFIMEQVRLGQLIFL
jgi:hypothetical protein